MSDKSKQAEERAQHMLQALLRQAAATPELAEILLRRMQEQLARLSAWCEGLFKLPRPERRRWQRRLGASLGGAGLALALALSQAPPAQAATITVDNSTCTLIDAITAANTDTATGGCSAGSGADTISLPGGTITLTGIHSYGNGLPRITSTITIAGNGTTITRSSASNFRIFQVPSTGNLTLNDTTISGGHAVFGGGGGIFNAGTLTLNSSTVSGNSAGIGGGIVNSGGGTLTLNDSTISGNSGFLGGGISNYATLTLNGSTVSSNTSSSAGGGIITNGTLTVTNSTISGNTSSGGSGGGGIFNFGTATVTNATISGNTASSSNYGGGGILNFGTVTLARSLISGNSASDGQEIYNYYAVLNAGNYNLFGHSGESNAQAFNFTPGGSDITATSDGSAPKPLSSILDSSLTNNGGDTLTHALVTGSPAIDAAPSGPATDQRGVARPQGPGYDIGAFESDTCGLIEAIMAANTDTAVGGCAAGSGPDTITLSGGTITLTSVNNTDYGPSGLPLITSEITIAGNGATIERDGSAADFRIFAVASSGDLTLNDTTISGGSAPSNLGGGIYNNGTLALNDSTVSANSAYVGGGIFSFGTLTLTGSTVSGNSASGSSTPGGGIFNVSVMTMTNSTVSGNSAGGDGGGISNTGTLTVTNSTLSGNSAGTRGGGIFSYGTVTLNRSLISGNTSSDGQEIYNFAGTLNAGNYNLFGHSALTNAQAFYGFTPSGSDITATSNGNDPTALSSILDTTLQNNGGDTETHALVSGSPAIDAAPSGPATDQRGVARPQGPAFDIGAFEQE